MIKMENDFIFNLGSLKIVQIGYIYRDIKKQIEIMKALYGFPEFVIIENKDRFCKYRGRDSKYSTIIAISRIFNTQIELIQWIEGECIFKEFIDRGREGLHHFGILVEDVESYISEFKQKGIDVMHAGQMGKLKTTYFDTEKTFGIYLEFQQIIKRKRKKS